MGSYTFTDEQLVLIEKLYREGMSSHEIKDTLGLSQTARSIQRRLRKVGLMRTMSEAFRNAIKRGRVIYTKSPRRKRKKLQYADRLAILTRDNFRCIYCGNEAKDARLQVDHKDNNPLNNDPLNLQTLCEPCNKGKLYLL